jgi:hypothetical protein
MLRALVDDQQRLRRRHGVAGLLDGELLHPAHGVGHLGVLGH